MDLYAKVRKQNRIIQLIQNIGFTVLALVFVVYTIQFSKGVGYLWKDISSMRESVDDVVGYAILLNGAAGLMSGLAVMFIVFLVMILLSSVLFFWMMFGMTYAKEIPVRRYCICTTLDAAVKILWVLFAAFSNIVSVWSLVRLFYLIGSIMILYNIYKIKNK